MSAELKKLQKQLKAKMEAKKLELKNLVEERKIQIQIAQMDNPLYIARELEKEDIKKLDAITLLIEEQYKADDRKLIHTYSYGVMVNKIMTIVSAIMYSKGEEKEHLLMSTNLTEQDLEDLIEAFGKTAYFSPKMEEIIPEVAMNQNHLKVLLVQTSEAMGLVSQINLSKINPENVEYQSSKAKTRAEESSRNHVKYNSDEAEAEEVNYSE